MKKCKKSSNSFFLRGTILIMALGVAISCHLGCHDSTTTTTRDDKGIWFIEGPEDISLYSVFESMGYAVAKDRLWQAELFRRQAHGRLAELFGDDYLSVDIMVRSMAYSSAELAAGCKALDDESREVINGYAAGFNRRIDEVRSDTSQLPFEFKILGAELGTSFLPEYWSCEDILAWISLMLRNFDAEALSTTQLENAVLYQLLVEQYGPLTGTAMFDDLRWTNDPAAQTVIFPTTAAPVSTRHTFASESREAYPPHPLVDTAAVDYLKAAEAVTKIHSEYIERMKAIGAHAKMGSYAWAVSGIHTESGNPILYSGPQMGFSSPAIAFEGSIRAGGLEVSGMTVAGIPGIIIGRTPHHAWSMQVGHAHTTDFYFESPETVFPHRWETVKVAGEPDYTFQVYRSTHGPIVNPMPYDPANYDPALHGALTAWKYSHWGYEFETIQALLMLARADSVGSFGAAIEKISVSQHFCYVDRDGNIAYWMSGRDPLRPAGEWRLPQGMLGKPLEWDAEVPIPRSTCLNTDRGYYGGWNNKSHPDYDNAHNSIDNIYGSFHRAHVITEYLDARIANGEKLSFEQLRDLAVRISTTDSFSKGGNPWPYVAGFFREAVRHAGDADHHMAALAILDQWDGHVIAGGKSQWATGRDVADGWLLMDAWLRQVMQTTFADEGMASQPLHVLVNVLIHGLSAGNDNRSNQYDWFQNADPTAPQTAEDIIVQSLDKVLTILPLDQRPWGTGLRDDIEYRHDLLGQTLHSTPFAQRSTYAHCVEYGPHGPVRIESMFATGQSGDIRMGADGEPVFDDNYFSMVRDGAGNPILFDMFEMRSFPLFRFR